MGSHGSSNVSQVHQSCRESPCVYFRQVQGKIKHKCRNIHSKNEVASWNSNFSDKIFSAPH